MIKCIKITYEALGQVHVAYTDEKKSNNEIRLIIKKIINTTYLLTIESVKVSEVEFETLNLSKVQEWIDDLDKYEIPVSENN